MNLRESKFKEGEMVYGVTNTLNREEGGSGNNMDIYKYRILQVIPQKKNLENPKIFIYIYILDVVDINDNMSLCISQLCMSHENILFTNFDDAYNYIKSSLEKKMMGILQSIKERRGKYG